MLHSSRNRITTPNIGGRVSGRISPRIATFRISANRIPPLLHWSFVLFIFMLPFDAANFALSESLSITKIFGVLFIAEYFRLHIFASRDAIFPSIPRAMWWFIGYFAIYVLNGLFIPEQYLAELVTLLITFFQLMVFFWLGSALMEEERIAKAALVSFSVASAILSVGVVLDLPGFSTGEYYVGSGRVTALGDNPNTLAMLMAMAAVVIIGIWANKVFVGSIKRCFFLTLLAPILVTMVNTGSRGGIAAFMLGCSVYLVPYARSKGKWVSIAILGFFAFLAVGYMVASNPELLERWNVAFNEGDLAGREEIMPATFNMFLERPLFGWRPINFWYELGSRLGIGGPRDAHNLYLHLLGEDGIIGAFHFLVGLCLCAQAAWRARRGHLGLLPVALLVVTFAANMSGTEHLTKPFWFVLALSLAVSTEATAKGRRFLVTVTEQSGKTLIRLKRLVPRSEAAKRPPMLSP